MTDERETEVITAADVGEMPAVPTPQAIIRSIERRCRGPLQEGARAVMIGLMAEGKNEAASAVSEKARKPCGYDVNELILAQPFDGASHEEPCPQCGTLIAFTSPVFPA